jgi:hypothetical protein
VHPLSPPDRLTSELRLAGATDLATATEVLRRFLPDYNRRFGRAPRETEKAWRVAPKDLSRICCFVHERIVSNDNVVQWDGRRFQIPPEPKRFSFAGAKVQLCESLRGRIDIYYGDSSWLLVKKILPVPGVDREYQRIEKVGADFSTQGRR